MQVLICGAGKISKHLLMRLGENWQVTLVDKSEEKLSALVPEFTSIQRIITGDASSPVLLEDAAVANFEYVLALTGDDRVNLAALAYARDQGVVHTLALVNEPENQARFHEIGAQTVKGSSMVAQNIYHYLQDPRIKVTPLNLGPADVLEVDVSHHFRIVGQKASRLIEKEWRLAAVFRDDKLFFPDSDTVIEPEDKLIIVGEPGIFKPVCDLLECSHPSFPLPYGHGLLLALAPGSDHKQMIQESVYLAQNTKFKHMDVLCSKEECDIEKEIDSLSQGIDTQVEAVEGDLFSRIEEFNRQRSYGLAVVNPFKAPFFRLLAKPALISLAHSLPCPLLLARYTHPYRRILVPFTASPMSEHAVGVAADLAKQIEAEIAVAVVEEPEFIRGPDEEDWVETVLRRARELAHIHKIEIREIIRRGNPVKEVAGLAKEFSLMIVGSTTRESGLFSPHVGELLVREASCSVLIIAK